jgi:hypothetical protein
MMVKYGYMHKIKNKVMSLINQMKKQNKEVVPDALTKSDIEFLLTMIKEASFKGEQLEQIYTIVYKLQQQYIK